MISFTQDSKIQLGPSWTVPPLFLPVVTHVAAFIWWHWLNSAWGRGGGGGLRWLGFLSLCSESRPPSPDLVSQYKKKVRAWHSLRVVFQQGNQAFHMATQGFQAHGSESWQAFLKLLLIFSQAIFLHFYAKWGIGPESHLCDFILLVYLVSG